MVRNPFHLVEYSPWPLIGSLGAFFLTSGIAFWVHGYSTLVMTLGLVIVLITMVQ